MLISDLKRNEYIGASDMNIIMNVSKFKTPGELLFEKAGLIKSEFISNYYTEFGNFAEPVIQEFCKVKNTDFVDFTTEINGYPIVGHTDGEIDDKTMVEIKTSSKDIEEIIEQYYPQIQMYMYLGNYEECKLINYIRTNEELFLERNGEKLELDPFRLQEKIIPRDEKYIKNMLEKLEIFISEIEIKKNLIEETYFLSHEELKLMIENYNYELLEKMGLKTTKVEGVDFTKLKELYSKKNEAEVNYKEEYNKITELLKKQNIEEVENNIVKIKTSTSTIKKFDKKAFEEKYPEIYKEFITEVENETTRFTFKK